MNSFIKFGKTEETILNQGKGDYYYKVNGKKYPVAYILHPSFPKFNYQQTFDCLQEIFG